MNQIDDGALLQDLRCKETRDIAFKVLVDNYFKPLTFYAVSLTGDHMAAKDIAQDVFMDFWRLKPFLKEDIRSFSKYLNYKCHQKALSLNRQNAGRKAHEKYILNTTPTSTDPSIKEDVAKYIAKLPEQQRRAIQLVILWDLPYAVAATVMGVTENTLKEHLKRAKKFLSALYLARP